jgi:hypothetical protein
MNSRRKSKDGDSEPLTTIRSRSVRRREITISFGTDKLYNLEILMDDDMGADDIAEDGVERPGARLRLGGLNASNDSELDEECRIERWLGEDEFRAIGKACLTAAGSLRRRENMARRRRSIEDKR